MSHGAFSKLAKRAARFTGKPLGFGFAVAIVLIWIATGPVFHYSDTWQLVINTGTTIITFLMVFLIQNTQNRDTDSLQIKLDELIRVTELAHNTLLDLEELDDKTLNRYRAHYAAMAHKARKGRVSDEIPIL